MIFLVSSPNSNTFCNCSTAIIHAHHKSWYGFIGQKQVGDKSSSLQILSVGVRKQGRSIWNKGETALLGIRQN